MKDSTSLPFRKFKETYQEYFERLLRTLGGTTPENKIKAMDFFQNAYLSHPITDPFEILRMLNLRDYLISCNTFDDHTAFQKEWGYGVTPPLYAALNKLADQYAARYLNGVTDEIRRIYTPAIDRIEKMSANSDITVSVATDAILQSITIYQAEPRENIVRSLEPYLAMCYYDDGTLTLISHVDGNVVFSCVELHDYTVHECTEAEARMLLDDSDHTVFSPADMEKFLKP